MTRAAKAIGGSGVGCLFVTFGAFFPRLAVLFIWLARPGMFEAAIGSALVALLGIIFLPFTTLVYVVLWMPGGLTGLDWLWVFLAFLLDLSALGASGYANRDRAGGFYSGGSTG
jgi:hypothetical protein